ncbi:MAG TPA: hypothetical protein VFC13_04150, partial [Actinomycetes bacterium]|nr:hypothetical protein [Actinomycetes bacterium]
RQQVPVERRFVHSLLPIAVGYAIAHYFSLAVFQGQAGYLLASDPWAAAGTCSAPPDPRSTTWWSPPR